MRSPDQTCLATGLFLACCAVLTLCGPPGCDGTPVYKMPDARPSDAQVVAQDAFIPPDGSGEIFAGVSIDGCQELTVTAELYECRGAVPLSVALQALGPPSATTFLWEFGDSSPRREEASVRHVYDLPGTYQVTLVVGGPFGAVSPTQIIQISAEPAGVGGYCAEDAQCASERCLCSGDDTTGCPLILQGTCVADATTCPADAVMVDLEVVDSTRSPGADAPWRAPLCLAGCTGAEDCARDGFGCREVPVLGASNERGWATACFPDLLGDVGEQCHSVQDVPEPALCLSGHCGELGRFGLCTEPCLDHDCPSYAACVSFTGGPLAGEAICLARCTAGRPCDTDPALTCEAADPQGDLGFTVLDPAEPTGTLYCAPRRCQGSTDCPSGSCDLQAGGFCE